MKNYKVADDYKGIVGGYGFKEFKAGDSCRTKDFPPGNAAFLEKKGILVEDKDAGADVKNIETRIIPDENGAYIETDYGSITASGIKAALKAAKIDFGNVTAKKTLWEMLPTSAAKYKEAAGPASTEKRMVFDKDDNLVAMTLEEVSDNQISHTLEKQEKQYDKESTKESMFQLLDLAE